MTIEVTEIGLYRTILILLTVMQMWQLYRLNKQKTEIDKLWQQITILTTAVAAKLAEFQIELSQKVGKSDKS